MEKNSNHFYAHVASVSTVIIPVGGFGTRMLPMTQAVPKALLPVGTKPLIVHAVDEALEAGAQSVVIAARPEEHDIFERQFHVPKDMREKIQKTGRKELLDVLDRCESQYFHKVNVLPIYNEQGPAATVRDTALAVGLRDEFFGVILPDDLYVSDEPVIGQLMQSFNKTRITTLGIRDVCLKSEKSTNGTFVQSGMTTDRQSNIERMQIKPKKDTPISSQVSNGRYILGAEFMRNVDSSYDPNLSEISMSAVIKNMVESGSSVSSYNPQGKYFDCGDFMRYQIAVASFLSSEVFNAASENFENSMRYGMEDYVSDHGLN